MFLQREIAALRAKGVQLKIYSMGGGGATFRGIEVQSFNKWRLLELLWLIPYETWRKPDIMKQLRGGLARRRAPLLDQLLGEHARGRLRLRLRPFLPAQPSRPDSRGLERGTGDGGLASLAHERAPVHGGRPRLRRVRARRRIWWLREKLEAAVFIHTSTELARSASIAQGELPGRKGRLHPKRP